MVPFSFVYCVHYKTTSARTPYGIAVVWGAPQRSAYTKEGWVASKGTEVSREGITEIISGTSHHCNWVLWWFGTRQWAQTMFDWPQSQCQLLDIRSVNSESVPETSEWKPLGAQLSTSPSHSSVYGSVGSVPGSVQANSLTMNSWFLLLITLVQWVTCSRSVCFVRAAPGIGRQEVHTCSRQQCNTREEVWLSLSPPAHSSLDLTDMPLVSRLWGLARCCCLCGGSGKGRCTE